ncbi:putative signaling protein [Ferriphaselus amnicola]|uniref:Putative signaling protein n=1 Tax=Ferriphaselus amnicola TaxID=1188319 RepID=A0A2Z6GCU2_9PROT|nr:putative signaling protein [Ferriphaselus amnicola]
MVMPSDFIPVAEQSDLIKEITRHMFPKLIKDMLVLMDIDEKLTMSFNASAKDFHDSSFARLMLEILGTSQLPAHALQVELTETATLEAGDTIKANIMPLREAGLGFAMDDFGMGYSSLDTLSKWPFTTIKLDQGIVSRMMDSNKSSTIVESSVRMAHELGISVVAEGVETNEQYQHLLEAGCTKIQGYWISKPLPLDRFIAFVEEDIRWSGIPIGLIHMAIIDHVQWRKQLVSEVVKLAALAQDSPQRNCQNVPPLSCKDCRLGQWYHGAGKAFSDRQSYIELAQPHCDFHEVGLLLVKMIQEGADLEALTPHLRELSDHSMTVLSKLQALENEGLIDMHAAHGEWTAHSLHPSKCND